MRRCFCCVAALLLTAAGASAQSAVTATPNPSDGSVPLVLRNGTAASVSLDSLRFASMSSEAPRFWAVYWKLDSEPSESGYIACERRSSCRDFRGLFGQRLPPGRSVSLEIIQYILTRPSAAARAADLIGDTLLVYSGGASDPLAVPITRGVIVSAEVSPEASALRLEVAPNPSRGASVVQVSHAVSGPVRVVAYDALGREAAILHDGPAAETLTLRIDTSAWASGVYVVRASADGAALSRRVVVVR